MIGPRKIRSSAGASSMFFFSSSKSYIRGSKKRPESPKLFLKAKLKLSRLFLNSFFYVLNPALVKERLTEQKKVVRTTFN